MGPTLPVTRHLITQEATDSEDTYYQIAISPGRAQPPQRGFDQQWTKEREGAHRPRTVEGRRRTTQEEDKHSYLLQDGSDISHDRTGTGGCINEKHPRFKQHYLIELNVGDNLVQSNKYNKYRHFTCVTACDFKFSS